MNPFAEFEARREREASGETDTVPQCLSCDTDLPDEDDAFAFKGEPYCLSCAFSRVVEAIHYEEAKDEAQRVEFLALLSETSSIVHHRAAKKLGRK